MINLKQSNIWKMDFVGERGNARFRGLCLMDRGIRGWETSAEFQNG
jgi:hypothetical protein